MLIELNRILKFIISLLKQRQNFNFLNNFAALLFSVTPATDHAETSKLEPIIFATGVLILGGYALHNYYNCESVNTINTDYCVGTMVETEMPEGLSSGAKGDWSAAKEFSLNFKEKALSEFSTYGPPTDLRSVGEIFNNLSGDIYVKSPLEYKHFVSAMEAIKPEKAYYSVTNSHPKFEDVEIYLKAYEQTRNDFVNDFMEHCYFASSFANEKTWFEHLYSCHCVKQAGILLGFWVSGHAATHI